jgi:hypothetical protein
MAYTTREYSSADTTLIFNSTPLIGLAPDSGIGVTRNADLTEEEVGMQGDLAISIPPDRSGTITLTFQQDSQGHRILSDLLNRQESGRFLLRAPLMAKFNTGETVIIPKAHLKQAPERTWGSSAVGSTRAWVFYGDKLIFNNQADFLSVANALNFIIPALF